MHGSVRDELENLLSAKPSAAPSTVSGHVSCCGECATELDAMRHQASLLKTLQSPAELEPSAGFYARVMQRIEESAKRSIWYVFVYSPVGKRLAYASLALTLALGSYVIAAESRDGHLSASTTQRAVPQYEHFDALVMSNADEQRSAVLQNFVAHPASFQTTSAQ